MKCNHYEACKFGWENRFSPIQIKDCPENTNGDCEIIIKKTPAYEMALNIACDHIRSNNCSLCPISNKPYCFRGFAENCKEALVKYFILCAENGDK